MALFKGNDFVSKMKETVEAAAGKAKETFDTAKANYEQKKAEEAQYRQEMTEKAAVRAQEIKDTILSYQNEHGFFDGLTLDTITSFTKEFYDKILMPANSVAQSKISMYPYIGDKQLQKFKTTVPEYDSNETALIYLGTTSRQTFVLTDQALYFSLVMPEDSKFYANGRIPCSEISLFTAEREGDTFLFKCDEYILATFVADKITTEDLTTLNNYFQCIINRDFTITDEEVDNLIREKIGAKVYAEVKKYLIYDDELMVYFAWGLDSLSAKDYVVCTTKQIIIVNREMLGATANIKQFYYEDITSASTEQNAKSSDLTTALIETALTAATKTCDLIISVAGAATRINTLYKVEAERVVAVYHQYRKAVKTVAAQPQVVVQQQQVDPLEQLKKLAEMKAMGIVTEEEFAQKKAELLAKI